LKEDEKNQEVREKGLGREKRLGICIWKARLIDGWGFR